MKRFIVAVVILLSFVAVSAQNIAHTAFETNGPMGECLFKENSKGEIIYQGIVEVPFSSDTILGLAREYLYTIEKQFNASISNRFEGITKVACDVELPVGVKYIDAGFAGTWAKAAATVNFNLVIDIRPGKYRYTLSHFETDRWRIPGDGKDKGQSNVIHWQRVNSLMMEKARARSKDIPEITQMIKKEKLSYASEHKAVMDFIDGLRTFCVISDDF